MIKNDEEDKDDKDDDKMKITCEIKITDTSQLTRGF